MKAIYYKTKNLNPLFQKKPLRPGISQNKSHFYKKNVKYDKNQKIIYFFCDKPVSKPVKS